VFVNRVNGKCQVLELQGGLVSGLDVQTLVTMLARVMIFVQLHMIQSVLPKLLRDAFN